jgi:peptidoglycan-associated lipoprotein
MAHFAGRALASALFVTIGVLTQAGCAHPRTPQSAEARPTEKAPAAVTRTTSRVVPVTRAPQPGLNVSDEIAEACAIHFDAVDNAPKFDFDKSDLRPDERALLDQVAKCATTGPLKGRALVLVGRADSRGEVEYNFVLGESRADSVRSYLTELGVAPARLDATSRGELDATGTDEASWQLDRRVDIALR